MIVYDFNYLQNKYNNVNDSKNHVKTSDIDYKNNCTFNTIDNVIIPFNITLKLYLNELKEYLTEEDFKSNYYLRPHLYSYDKYKTTELWYLIMMLNDIYDITEFKGDKIKYLSVEGCERLRVIFKEKNSIINSRNKLYYNINADDLIIKKI